MEKENVQEFEVLFDQFLDSVPGDHAYDAFQKALKDAFLAGYQAGIQHDSPTVEA